MSLRPQHRSKDARVSTYVYKKTCHKFLAGGKYEYVGEESIDRDMENNSSCAGDWVLSDDSSSVTVTCNGNSNSYPVDEAGMVRPFGDETPDTENNRWKGQDFEFSVH